MSGVAIVRIFVFFAALIVAAAESSAEVPSVRIGVVIDGPWSVDSERVHTLFEREVLALTRGEFAVSFPADKTIVSDATTEGVERDIDRLLSDPQVDIVIAGGLMASHDVGQRRNLPKPVIAPVVIEPLVQGIPLQGQVSGVHNLSYVSFPIDIQHDLKTFAEVVELKSITMLYAAAIERAVPALVRYYVEQAEQVGISVTAVAVDGSVEEALASIPTGADGVFIALPLHLSPAAEDALAQGLIERGLPSYTALSTDQVERGFMMGLHSEVDVERLVRRTALSVQRILLGEAPEELPVVFSRRQRLTLNMQTVRALGIDPSWGVLTEAQLVQDERVEAASLLTLVGAVQEALRANSDLLAGRSKVAAGREDVRQGRAALLPQVDWEASGVLIDKSRASFLSQAEQTLSTSATLRQLIYAEGARANSQIQRYLQRARQLELEQLRLDIVQEVATAYLDVLRAQTFERVQEENLALTRSNLELARLRQRIGASGPAEVYRWESQIANGRKALIAANAQRNVAEIALNRLLQRPLEETFVVGETGLHDPELVTHDERFMRYMSSPQKFKVLRMYMVEDGLQSAPELQRLDAAIAVGERALKAASRALWAPTVAVQGRLSSTLYEGGEGSEAPPAGALPIPLSDDDTHWDVGASVNLPLYDGGGKYAQRRQAKAELEELRLQRQALKERVEQRIRSALHVAGASYAGISLAADAAVAANRNFELVKDAYSRGTVNILALLDAQNAAILAEEGAANAAYDFLVDLMAAERSIGKFYFWASQERRDEWFDGLETFARQRAE